MEVCGPGFRHGHHVDHAIRTGIAVNHRRGGDSDLGSKLIALPGITRDLSRAQSRYLPQLSAGIGVKRIHAAMLSRYEEHIVVSAADSELGQVKRLGVDFSIYREGAKSPEGGRVDVGGGQNRFIQVLTGAG